MFKAMMVAGMVGAAAAATAACATMQGAPTRADQAVQSAATGNIVDTAVAAGSFKTLVAALKAAELTDALKGKGPFTVFAPTDEAFARLPAGTVENLLKPENRRQLQAVLKYHVVAGNVPADKVMQMRSADTLNGQRIPVAVRSGKVMAGKATVVKADISASNGVVARHASVRPGCRLAM